MKNLVYQRKNNGIKTEKKQQEEITEYCKKMGLEMNLKSNQKSQADILKEDMMAGKVEKVFTTKENRKYVEKDDE